MEKDLDLFGSPERPQEARSVEEPAGDPWAETIGYRSADPATMRPVKGALVGDKAEEKAGHVPRNPPPVDKLEKALEYLRRLWPEIEGDAASWARRFTGGFTDADFRRGCEYAAESKRAGNPAPDAGRFRLWCMGVDRPGARKDPERARAEFGNLRKLLRDADK